MKIGRLEQSVALTAYVVEIFYAQISWGQLNKDLTDGRSVNKFSI